MAKVFFWATGTGFNTTGCFCTGYCYTLFLGRSSLAEVGCTVVNNFIVDTFEMSFDLTFVGDLNVSLLFSAVV